MSSPFHCLREAAPGLSHRKLYRVLQHHFIVFGKRHLDYLTESFTEYYNTKRSHMERDHLPPIREAPDEVEKLTMDRIEVKEYVGGLVKSFERKVA